MIIDDESDFIDVLTMTLADDFRLMAFTNPLEALTHSSEPQLKLILTDMTMPQMNGIEVVKKIRAQNGKVPIVLITGLGKQDEDVQTALKVGGTEVLVKPIRDLNLIGETIRKLIIK